MLGHREHVLVISQDFKRYVGAQIGIHNPKGEKVGKVSHLRNKEYVYIATDDAEVAARTAAFCAAVDVQSERAAQSALRPRATTETTFVADGSGAGDNADLLSGLARFLERHREASSSDAQQDLGVDAAALRPFFLKLIDDGRVVTSGQRRGTKYRWVEQPLKAPDAPPERVPAADEPQGAAKTADRLAKEVGEQGSRRPAPTRVPSEAAQQSLFPLL